MMRVTPRGRNGKRALILTLHGAASHWYGGLYAFRGGWDVPGLVLVAPEARASTGTKTATIASASRPRVSIRRP